MLLMISGAGGEGSASGEGASPVRWAAQLDGNPCSGEHPPTNMTKPMLYEGCFLKKYMTVRPTIANGKTELNPMNP